MLCQVVGAPTRVDDLQTIYKKINPLAPKWKEIGKKLIIGNEKLYEIESEYGGIAEQCLREMLREYLQKVDSYEHLAEVIKEYDPPLSLKILQLERSDTYQLTIN